VVIKPGKYNVGSDHLSRIEFEEVGHNLDDEIPDAHVFIVEVVLYQLANIVV